MMPESGERSLTVIDLAIEARIGGQHALFTYLSDGIAQVGDAYLAPLGVRQVLGYVLRVRSIEPHDLGFPADRLRRLSARVEGLALPTPTLDLIQFVSKEYLCPISVSLGLATPPGARNRIVTTWTLVEGAETRLPVSATQKEALRIVEEHGGKLEETRSKPLASGSRKALQALVARGLLTRELRISHAKEKHRLEGNYRLTVDSDQVEQFLRKQAKRKPAQALALMRLQGSESTSFSAQEIKALSECTDQTIRALLQAGLIEKEDQAAPTHKAPPIELNDEQKAALEPILDAIHEGRHEAFLLFGVTGSGKTEVYLRAAAEALKRGSKVLYLVPEIALTAQVIAQLRSRFGRGVAVLHSNLDLADRLENWLRIRSGEAAVILGARSALFAPIENLGLVVVDEEHEGSYKQESSPRYHARRVAIEFAKRMQAPIILGSATPSIESYYAAEEGDLRLLTLKRRAANATLPEVEVEDLSELFHSGRPSLFSDALYDGIKATLAGGQQSILFLNRRAYAPFLVCRDCGHQFKCPHCSVSLALHRRDEALRCHQCGFAERAPETCPECGGSRVRPFGAGTQKVEESIKELFPDAAVGRLDRDVARKKGALEETLAAFRGGDLQILVGTQMVAKGLDFPNVTLVGVVAADVSLNVPDFRASERTFQLLSQVSGRAGRGKLPGRVIIQTFNPKHPSVLHTVDHDFEGLYRALIEERREAHYPPFVRLVNLVFSGKDKSRLEEEASHLHQTITGLLPQAEALGPTDCALERLNGEWRMHILLKVPIGTSLEPLESIIDSWRSEIQLLVDVDPLSLL